MDSSPPAITFFVIRFNLQELTKKNAAGAAFYRAARAERPGNILRALGGCGGIRTDYCATEQGNVEAIYLIKFVLLGETNDKASFFAAWRSCGRSRNEQVWLIPGKIEP